MSFITVSKLREDGDYDVVVAFSEEFDDQFDNEQDRQASEEEGDVWSGQSAAENFQQSWGHTTGEQLYLHRVDQVSDVLDGAIDEMSNCKVE